MESNNISVWIEDEKGEWVSEYSATKNPQSLWISQGEEPGGSGGSWDIHADLTRIYDEMDIWGLRRLLDEIEKRMTDAV